MALGSSAPEILLSIIETTKDIEATPSALGPSTIVGSAAFNLLIISAVSIVSVGDEPKAIYDLGVFAITSVCSLWAYIWMYLILQEFSANEIEVWEAWLTLFFFFVLIGFSYAADKFNKFLTDKQKSAEDRVNQDKETEIKAKKDRLRIIASKDYTELIVI